MSYHLIYFTKKLNNILPYFIWWCQSINMEKEVSRYAQTQETIGLIPPVVPFNFLCSCIGLYFSCHSHSIEAFRSQQYLHIWFPFKEVKWSQDDLLRLIHSSEIVTSVSRMILVNDVKPAIKNWKERNQSTKALIPCGNWTQVLEQLPITHANYSQRRLNIEQNTNLYWISVQ